MWLQNPTTRVVPDLTFAQVIPGTAWGGAIIDFSYSWMMQHTLDSLHTLLTSNGGCSDPTLRPAVLQWTANFSLWLNTSYWGAVVMMHSNNHITAYHALSAHLCLFRGDIDCALMLLTRARDILLPNQVLPTGEQPFETIRGDGISYSLQNLRTFLQMATMAGNTQCMA